MSDYFKFKLKSRTIKSWLDQYSAHGDSLTVIKLDTGGTALHNERTNMIYFVSEHGEGEAEHQTEGGEQ